MRRRPGRIDLLAQIRRKRFGRTLLRRPQAKSAVFACCALVNWPKFAGSDLGGHYFVDRRQRARSLPAVHWLIGPNSQEAIWADVTYRAARSALGGRSHSRRPCPERALPSKVTSAAPIFFSRNPLATAFP